MRTKLLPLALCLGAAVPAQWDSTPSSIGAPVIAEGFHVTTTTTGGDIVVFSAMTRKWRNLGRFEPFSKTDLVLTGDWTVLIKRPGGLVLTAYSARLDKWDDLTLTSISYLPCVDDDVAFVWGQRPNRVGTDVCGFSAQFGKWVCQPVSNLLSYTCSRFVIGIIDGTQNGPVSWGFSARHGAWVMLPCGASDKLQANGNVLLLSPPAPPAQVSAFSGVLGTWAKSPPQAMSSEPKLAHNVAYIKAESTQWPNAGANCGYSAYTGAWSTQGKGRPEVRLRRNVIFVRSPSSGGYSCKAFGARPGSWSPTLDFGVPQSAPDEFDEEDWLAVFDKDKSRVFAFSGLCDGTWHKEDVTGSLSMRFNASTEACDSLAVGTDGAGMTHAFSTIHAAWAPARSGGISGVGACYTMELTASSRTGYSIQDNKWTAGPARDPARTYRFGGSGSTLLDIDTTTGQITTWLPRESRWDSISVGHKGTPSYYRTHNVILMDTAPMTPKGPVYGFSAQRGDLVSSGAMDPVEGPFVEDNVGWFRTADNVVHAFGSPQDTHAWFGWFCDTEFQGPTAPMKLMIRGTPGDRVFLLFGLDFLHPGLALGGIKGLLRVTPDFILDLGPTNLIQPNGLLDKPYQLPLAGAPPCLGFWVQGALVNAVSASFLGPAPELVRVF